MNCRSALILLFIAYPHAAMSDQVPTLPYSSRSQSYSGWSATVRGDLRTVGMAGATVGLADTFIAASDNPAGLAITLDNGDTNYAQNQIHNAFIQDYSSTLTSSSLGAALNVYPWGFSLGYIKPYNESQLYSLAGVANNPVELNSSIGEFHVSAAHLFFGDKLSLGACVVLARSETSMSFTQPTQANTANHSFQAGAVFGASAQLPYRLLPGLSVALPMHFSSASSDTTPALPGFSQAIDVPLRVGAGLGWVPNRFFRADFSTFVVGTTHGAALLRDQAVAVGQKITVQPRLGIAYTFAEYKEFKGVLFVGSYYEMARIDGTINRAHTTAAMELKPWIFTLGWGIDSAPNYENYLVSIGVDAFKVAAKLDFIPTPAPTQYGGLFPRPSTLSDAGLPRPLVKDWRPTAGPDLDPINVGLDLPKKLEEFPATIPARLKQGGEDLWHLGVDFIDTLGTLPEEMGKLVFPDDKQPGDKP